MSKHKSILTQVKMLLGVDVKLMQATLENGSVIEAESWEAGEPVFVVTEDERIPLPEGNYTTEDGVSIVVEEEGIIAEVMGSDSKEEEMSEEPAYATKAEVEALTASLNEIKELLSSEKVEQSKEEAPAEEAKEDAKQELSKEEPKNEAEKVELSEDMPAAKAIKPNPEREADKRKMNLYAQRRPQTTADTVRSKIFSIKHKK